MAVSAVYEDPVETLKREIAPGQRHDKRDVTRARIRDAARHVIARRGFATTVDEVAKEAGISNRTVFRYYPTRDVLIADATKEMFEVLVEPIEGLPDPAEDLDGWLSNLSLQIHTRLADVLGQAFWDIRVPDPASPQASAQSEDERPQRWASRTVAPPLRRALQQAPTAPGDLSTGPRYQVRAPAARRDASGPES